MISDGGDLRAMRGVLKRENLKGTTERREPRGVWLTESHMLGLGECMSIFIRNEMVLSSHSPRRI